MSLYEDAMTDVVMLDKSTTSDGEGGYYIDWAEGARFMAAVTFDTSMQARTAEAQGVTSKYTVTTHKNVTLGYHDVFKRLSDGKVFRVTSDGEDKATPKSASLNMRVVTAEEWSLPT